MIGIFRRNTSRPKYSVGINVEVIWRWIFGLIALAVVLASFVRVYLNVTEVPYMDEWNWSPLILEWHQGRVSIAALWQQHNEHRIFFPQVLMLALDTMGWWSQRRECLISFTIETGGFWLVWRLLQTTLSRNTAYQILAVDAFIFFAPAQVQNWLWGFQSAWFIVNLSVLAILVILTSYRIGIASLIFSGLFAAIAAYSLAFGLGTLPAVFAVLLIRRKELSPWIFGVWGAISLAISALFFYGWQKSAVTSDIVAQVFHGLIVIGASLGGGSVPLSAILGGTAFIFTAAAGVTALRTQDSKFAKATAPWIGLATYGLCASMLIGAGRADLGPDQALGSRYVTCSLTIWIAIVALSCLLLGAFQRSIGKLWPTRVAQVISGLFILALYVSWNESSVYFAAMRDSYSDAHGLLQKFKVVSDEKLAVLYPELGYVRMNATILSAIGQLPEAQSALTESPPEEALAATGQLDEVQLAESDRFVASGWLANFFDTNAHMLLMGHVDGHPSPGLSISYGSPRPDVLAAYGIESLANSGFNIVFRAKGLSSGRHVLTLFLEDRVGRKYPMHGGVSFNLLSGKITDAEAMPVE